MLQNPCKTLGFKKNMVYKIPPGGGGKPYPASGLYCPILTFEDDSTYKHAKDKSDCNSFLLAVLSKYNG